MDYLRPYHIDEIKRFNREVKEIETAPLQYRKERKDKFARLVTQDIKALLERVSWVINGSYGQGSWLVLNGLSKKSNRARWLFCTVACLEYHCTYRDAELVFKRLDANLQNAIRHGIEEQLKEMDQEKEQ